MISVGACRHRYHSPRGASLCYVAPSSKIVPLRIGGGDHGALPYERERATLFVPSLSTHPILTIPLAIITCRVRFLLPPAAGACERIFKTPIPIVYTGHTSRFVDVWLGMLPLAIWGVDGSWNHLVTIPSSAAIVFFLLGIEELGLQVGR